MFLFHRRLHLTPQAAGSARKAYNLVFDRLYAQNGGYDYMRELGKRAEKLGTTPQAMVETGRKQLESPSLAFDRAGRIINAKKAGKELAALLDCTYKAAKICVVADKSQVGGRGVPLPQHHGPDLHRIVDSGEAAVLIFAKVLPEKLQDEARRIGEERFHLLTWLDNPKMWHHAGMGHEMKDYLLHSTIWVGCTGGNGKEIAAHINRLLEQSHGFERHYMKRLARSMTEKEKRDTLAQILLVCAAVAGVIEVIKNVYPKALYIVGGALSDIFGAIIPDVSQSVGHIHLIKKDEKGRIRGINWGELSKGIKRGWKVFLGGAIGLVPAMIAGWGATQLYDPGAPIGIRIIAGALFAIACAAGTVGTSIAATAKAYKAYHGLEKDGTIAHNGAAKRLLIAMDEAIWKVPFRKGHTVFGLPLQLIYGVLAGAFLFFDRSWFIISEGVLEIVLGSATAFGFTKWADFRLARKMRNWGQGTQ